MGDGIFLDDLDRRTLEILEIDVTVPVGVHRYKLRLLCQQVRLRDGFLDDLHHRGQEVGHHGNAVLVRLHLRDGVAVRASDQIDRSGDRFAGIAVPFMDIQIGAAVIGQHLGAGLARKQLDVVFSEVEDVIRSCGNFRQGIDAGFQALPENFSCRARGAVQIIAAVLDLSQPEGNALQRCAVRALLDEQQRGQPGVGEHILGVHIGAKVDDALGVVHHIAGTGLLRDHIRARGEVLVGQVDLALGVGSELLRAVAAVHGLDLEDRVGNDFRGIGGIHLGEPQAGCPVIEEQQLPDTVPGLELHLLGRGVQDQAGIPCVHLHGPVSARFLIGE